MIESYWSLRIYLIQYPLQDSFYHHDHLWRTGLTPHCLPCGLSLCLLPTLWRSLWQISSTISSTDLSIHFSIESAVWSSLHLSFTTVEPLIPTIQLLISHILPSWLCAHKNSYSFWTVQCWVAALWGEWAQLWFQSRWILIECLWLKFVWISRVIFSDDWA
jgi:hypothetical protein